MYTLFCIKSLEFNLEAINPETTFFHPAKIVEQIYDLANENYNKSKGNIEALMASLQKEDFENLRNSDKCSSFKEFSSLLK
jgi:glucan biosynthesis protein